jgi:hypothetical protein
VRPPSLSLPKGGGAIRPLGDTFKTNPSTGTGTYAIPIPAPQARGFGPSLALTYDSGSGNGPFGLGWSLSLGSITRRTDRQLPLYNDGGNSDIFVLSGAEDLVPEHPPLPDNDPEVRVVRYRPRTEGGFARIERRILKSTGETHWVVRSGDGSVRFYGRTPDSRIFDPKDARRVFSWLLDRVEDDRGNVLEVQYAAENTGGVHPHDCAESHRIHPHRGVDITANRYPKRIRYGNTVMGALALFDPENENPGQAVFEIVFDYGEHDALAPTPQPAPGATWPVRQDPFSTYRAGFELRTYRLCRRILVFHRFPSLGTTP